MPNHPDHAFYRVAAPPLAAPLLAALFLLVPVAASAAPALPKGATPTPSAAKPAPAPPAAAGKTTTALAPTSLPVAVSAIRLLTPMLQFKVEGHLGEQLVAGGSFSWGSPKPAGLDNKSQVEVGAHCGWFPLGKASRGIGLVGRVRGLQSTGKLGKYDATSYGVSGTLFFSGRYTFDSNALVELQVGRDYLYSWAGVDDGGDGTWLGQGGTLANLWFGWSF